MLLSPRSFRMKVNGSFYPPSSSGVGTLPTRPDKPSPRRTLRSIRPKRVRGEVVARVSTAGEHSWARSHGRVVEEHGLEWRDMIQLGMAFHAIRRREASRPGAGMVEDAPRP